MSPTVLRVSGYQFSWWSNERREPPHVHVRKGAAAAKWWLHDMEEAYSEGFNPSERRMIRAILQDYQLSLLQEWYARFPEAP